MNMLSDSMHRRSSFCCTAAPVALICGLAAVALTPQAARAETQGNSAPAAAPAAPAEVGEVIVTARRRAENLARVPLAVTAFSAQQLVEKQIRNDTDLQLATPGLTIRQTQGPNTLTYSIRGQTADTFSGSPSAVVPYLNEVPITSTAVMSFYDLDSVQVLKGPQGTLFGRNATGGAVLYSTAKPTNDFGGYVRARAGNLAYGEAEGALNIPIVADKVLLRAAFDVTNRDGYIQNLFTGQELGQIRRQSGRVSLTLKPTETVTNTTMFQYTHAGGTNTGASYLYSAYSPGQTNNGFALFGTTGALYGPSLDSVFGLPGAWNTYLALHPGAFPGGVVAYVDEQKALGPYKTNYTGDETHRENDWFLSNNTTVDLSDNLTLRNILGFSRSWTHSEAGSIGAPYNIFLSENFATGFKGNRVLADSTSEEIQLQGKAFDGKLTYVTGFYFQHQQVDTVWPQVYFELEPFIPPANVTSAFRSRNRTEAVYAQGSYDLGSWVQGLKVTAGIRYTWENVYFVHLPESSAFGAPSQTRDFSDPSWEVGLEYQATPGLFTYVKTRGSFRSGGFNGAAPPLPTDATGGGNMFNSEHTQDIEAGAKWRGDILGRPAALNADVFNQWIQDVQHVEFPAVPGGSIAVTVNVPAAVIRGIEADGVFQPTTWLETGASLSLTTGKYTNPRVSLFGTEFVYGPFADTPKVSGTVYGAATVYDEPQVGKFILRGDLYGRTYTYFSSSFNSITPGTKLPGYVLFDARLDWNNIQGSQISAALFGKNLTNKAYFTGGIPLGASLGVNDAVVGEPRTWGIELSAKF
jgi:iron complex outermembrane receptor protein